MYRIDRNNFHTKPKNSTIYTPKEVSEFIFYLLKDKVEPGIIFDPCCGKRSLLESWLTVYHDTFGLDNDKVNSQPDLWADFLTLEKGDCENFFQGYLEKKEKPTLILCNPPFNGYGRQLGSEVWLAKIIELFGKEILLVLFAPVGFCMNMTLESKRLEKFENGAYPPIVGRITLPKNIFPNVLFHSEILIFNIKGLEPHYFYREKKYE